MKKIKAYSGDDILVDNEDYDFLSQFNWSYLQAGCNRKTVFRIEPSTKELIIMKRIIMKCKKSEYVIHLDDIRLNHQKKNLRKVTLSQLRRTSPPKLGKKYKGVYKVKTKRIQSYNSYIYVNGRFVSLGSKRTEEDAAKMYDAAVEFLGYEYSYRNFPGKKYELPKDFQKKIEKMLTIV